jgi:hypothetical protein
VALRDFIAYKGKLENQESIQEPLGAEYKSVAIRLERIKKNIENATFEERFYAVSELVKEITVNKIVIVGKENPVVTIPYRFNELKDNSEHNVDENYIPERSVFDHERLGVIKRSLH